MKIKFNNKMMIATLLLASLALGLSSCEKDEPEVKKEEVKTVRIPAESYTKWVYFSFEKGTTVTVTDDKVAESLDWDLGFLRYNMRTNSGKSGIGKGGVLATTATNLDAVVQLPSGSFIVDDEIQVVSVNEKGQPIMPPKYIKIPGNKDFVWASFDSQKYTYNNNVFVIRTASGKYAKVIMKSFQKEDGASGLITMDYVYPFNPAQ